MSVDAPFVQMRSMDVLAILPYISKSTTSVVFLALGAFLSDPIAPTQRDIRNHTQLSRGSVSTALEFLCKQEFAHCFVDGDGVTRYRIDDKYFRYGGSSPVSVREPVPVSGQVAEADAQILTSPAEILASSTVVVVGTVPKTKIEHESTATSSAQALKILHQAGIFSAYADFANAGIADDQARAIADWIATAPKKNPAGYAHGCLKRDPRWQPMVQESLPWGDVGRFIGADQLRRADLSDVSWHRISPDNRRQVIANERGLDLGEAVDDEHYGCKHESAKPA